MYGVLLVGRRVCSRNMQFPWSPEEGVGFPGTRVRNGCETPSLSVLRTSPHPLEEQPVVLAAGHLLSTVVN